jgi:uncharacterized protein (TIGR02145 family)
MKMKWMILLAALASMAALHTGCNDSDQGNDSLPAAVFDNSGNQYAAITIGTQVWLNENLRTTRYNNGDNIATTDNASVDITAETNPKYQWIYFDGSEPIGTGLGRLYTWHVINDPRGICPPGFRVATESDWNALNTFLGGDFVINGGKLKIQGTGLWQSPNQGATNAVGFNGLPSGNRLPEGTFTGYKTSAVLWTSTGVNSTESRAFTLTNTAAVLGTATLSKSTGAACRCIKEN